MIQTPSPLQKCLFQNLKISISRFLEVQLIPLIYLYRHAKEEGEEVHDGEAWEQLPLQEHGGVVVVAVLHCGVVLV